MILRDFARKVLPIIMFLRKNWAKMHKAIAVIQFKLEGKLVRRHKEFQMEDRALLHRINPEKDDHTA